MASDAMSALIDELVIAVHRSVSARRGDVLRPIIDGWGLARPGIVIDLAEFSLAGSLTFEVAQARFPFVPPEIVRDELDTAAAIESLDADLSVILGIRSETASSMWAADAGSLDAAVTGAANAIRAASQPLSIAHRALPLPGDAPLQLHHVLTGLRYERLGAHVTACDRAGLARSEAVALTAAWTAAEVDRSSNGLVRRGLIDREGALSPSGRQLRDRIEAETDAACEPMWAAVGDLDGWSAALSALRAASAGD